ncbi:hypothetical protein JIX59_03500 [Brevundimonas diminuta]|uniref:DNA polymerase n=1 Tax=Brevundimonas diminuta TaxID=293 RepID=UPI001906C3D0|nr:DNA polymerase [Brevundimonas diminuta]MBK1968397.1 hypothetical protein [Brevundimonas diminuta]
MLVYDLETDGLLDAVSRVHCLNIQCRVTGRRWRFNAGSYADGTPTVRDGDLADGLALLDEAEVIGGHNVIGYDNAVLLKLFKWKPKAIVRDSMVEARVIWTNLWDIDEKAVKRRKRPDWFVKERLMGSHKLKAWGARLGNFKGEYDGGWEHFTRDMDDYCAQDNDTTCSLFDKIDAKEYSQESLRLENQVAFIIGLQERHGFLFDTEKAVKLEQELFVRRAELEDQLRQTFQPWYEPKRYKGQHEVVVPKRDNKKLGYQAGVPFTKVVLQTFNPGSRDQIANRMKVLFDWHPVEFTESGKPKVDETTLSTITAPEAKLLVEFLTVEKRIGQISTGDNAWLKMVHADNRMHGYVNTNGAVTGRMTHSKPNMAQVPKVKTGASGIILGYAGGWGYECRSLFIVAPGRLLVGCDAEGLELRMLGHYMARYDGGAYADAVVNGKKEDGTDVHTVNMRVVMLRSRDSAKTFIYAYLYGAGDHKLGCVVFDDMSDEQKDAFNARHPAGEERDKALVRLGKRARARIEDGLPALGQLQKLIKEKAKRGFLKSFDGRKLHVRSQHSALNTLLQGGGAVVMKKALVICHEKFTQMGWVHGREYAFVANVHDEFQMEVQEQLAEIAGQVAADSIREAGEAYGCKCPLAGAYDIGHSWADSH